MAVTRTAKARPLNGQAETNGPVPSGATPTGAEAQQESNNNSRSERFGAGREAAGDGRSNDRYRRLPTGAHGMAREEVARDQRDRLQRAMTELIVARGYQAVRILDLTQLAHVSRPTFYELYADKEELLLAAYDDIAR